jgi:hypothetical protein
MVAIRRRLESDPAHPRHFITETGAGIRFVPEGLTQLPSRHSSSRYTSSDSLAGASNLRD